MGERLKRHFWNYSHVFFCFFFEKCGDAEISINRWLLVICRVMKTFPCCKSLSFLTTSLGRRTQQIRSLCLFYVNRKNKRRLWRMVVGGNIWLNPHSANHRNMKKTYMKKDRHQAAAWFIFPPSSQFQEFYEWKMSGDRFSKAAMASVSWAYHAVLVSSCCLEQWCGAPPEGRDPCTPTSTLHHAVWLFTGKPIHTSVPECAKLKSWQQQ